MRNSYHNRQDNLSKNFNKLHVNNLKKHVIIHSLCVVHRVLQDLFDSNSTDIFYKEIIQII